MKINFNDIPKCLDTIKKDTDTMCKGMYSISKYEKENRINCKAMALEQHKKNIAMCLYDLMQIAKHYGFNNEVIMEEVQKMKEGK